MRWLSRRSPAGWSSLGASVLSAALWFGCADSPQAPVPPDVQQSRQGGALERLQEIDLTPALEAQERHGASLMRIPGVVGHGVGVDADGDPTITVFTLQAGVPGIPARLDDVPTRTVASGQFVAGALTGRLRPAPNGYSLGHPDITAGTLGAVVRGNSSGVCYALSNNHVLANSNDANLGDSALQPGPFDGGSDPADAIGALADFQVIAFDGSANRMDAAIAEVFAPVDGFVTAETPNYAPGSTVTAATVELGVKKVGRTTELSFGEVTEVNVSLDVCYACSGPFCFRCTKVAHYEGQIATTEMSEGGDSGSLLVTDDANANPVGLLFAGSSTRTIHNPIDEVLTRFDATVIQNDDLASCTNGGGGTEPPPNVPPTADFTFTVSGLTVDFTDASTDADGTIALWSWDFGDGGTSTDQNPSHTYASGGTYSVTLTATDDDGSSDAVTKGVTVSESAPASGMHVGDLDDAGSVNNGSTWTARVTIRIHDADESPVSGAAVSGSWSGGASGSGSCTTDSAGSCTVTQEGIPKRNGTASFTVEDVTASGQTYAAGDNHDPDGDSDGTSITVSKP